MRRRLFLGLLGTTALVAGCAALRANAAREGAIQSELDRYVVPKPLAEVWSAVGSADTETDTLLWQGYTFTWKDTGTYRKQTDKKTTIEPGSGDKRRTTRWFEAADRIERAGDQAARAERAR